MKIFDRFIVNFDRAKERAVDGEPHDLERLDAYLEVDGMFGKAVDRDLTQQCIDMINRLAMPVSKVPNTGTAISTRDASGNLCEHIVTSEEHDAMVAAARRYNSQVIDQGIGKRNAQDRRRAVTTTYNKQLSNTDVSASQDPEQGHGTSSYGQSPSITSGQDDIRDVCGTWDTNTGF